MRSEETAQNINDILATLKVWGDGLMKTFESTMETSTMTKPYCTLHARSCFLFVRGRALFLEVRRVDFLVIRVCYVSRSNTLKS